VLIDGVMTNHEVRPGQHRSVALVTVKGEDLTGVMDFIDSSGIPFPAMPPSRPGAAPMLAKYAVLRRDPAGDPERVRGRADPHRAHPAQQGTDLAYVTQLAEEVGLRLLPRARARAGLEHRLLGAGDQGRPPQPALNVDMDAHTNVESLSFSFDKDAKRAADRVHPEPATKAPIPIPIPDITPLNPPLGVVPPLPPKITCSRTPRS
jgi:hypothetical protein